MKQPSLALKARSKLTRHDDLVSHIWDAEAKFAYMPLCIFCGISTTDAQKKHPENGGIGPCADRARLASQPIAPEEVEA